MRKLITITFLVLTFYVGAENPWVNFGDYPGGKAQYLASFTINDCAYVGLGNQSSAASYLNTFYKFDPSSITPWVPVANFPGSLRSGTVSFSIGNYGFVGLGNDSQFNYSKDFYRYSPATDKWEAIADFPGAARSGAFAFVINGKAYVGSGRGSAYYTDMYEYNPTDNSWKQVASYTKTLANAVAFAVDTKGYVCSGIQYLPYTNMYSGVDMYDPTANSWTKQVFSDGLLQNRFYGTAFVANNKGFIVGGNLSAASVITYDPQNNGVASFNQFGNVSDKNEGQTSFVIQNKAFVIGGYYWTGSFMSSVSVYLSEVWSMDLGTPNSLNNVVSNNDKLVITSRTNGVYDVTGFSIGEAYSVFNINGERILTGIANDAQLEIDLSNQTAGIYLLRVNGVSVKFIR